MSKEKEDNSRRASRHPVVLQRVCFLGIMPFKSLEWSDHVASIVDISRNGVGIESDEQLEPGFVWFKERVGGYKSGVLMWCKRRGKSFRGGIKFVPLSLDDEQYLQHQAACPGPHTARRDPKTIIATIIDSLTKDRKAGN